MHQTQRLAEKLSAPDTRKGNNFAPERIAALTQILTEKISNAINEIDEINDRTHLLSLNARIESARAGGEAGAAFGIVASAIKGLSEKSSLVATQMANETQTALSELEHINAELVANLSLVNGMRISDLALTNIELIDRNLYERSCDVRWWATDRSVTEALTAQTTETQKYCAGRLGAILNAYTVYFDLILCDLTGKIVANGRPEIYRSVGLNCGQADWFRAALATRSGDEFGFESVHVSPLVNGKRVLAYSCAVRAGGESNGEIFGVLGILFNWDSLAQTVVCEAPVAAERKAATRLCIVDDAGLILADTERRQLQESLDLRSIRAAISAGKGHALLTLNGKSYLVGYAHSPGYETYKTGWHSLILQDAAAG